MQLQMIDQSNLHTITYILSVTQMLTNTDPLCVVFQMLTNTDHIMCCVSETIMDSSISRRSSFSEYGTTVSIATGSAKIPAPPYEKPPSSAAQQRNASSTTTATAPTTAPASTTASASPAAAATTSN